MGPDSIVFIRTIDCTKQDLVLEIQDLVLCINGLPWGEPDSQMTQVLCYEAGKTGGRDRSAMSVGLVFDGVGADGEVSATRERIQVDPCRA